MERAPVVSVNTRGCIQFTNGKRSGPKHLSLDGFGWLRKLPAAEFEMLEDRLRNYYTILLFQPLVEAWDRYLAAGGGGCFK